MVPKYLFLPLLLVLLTSSLCLAGNNQSIIKQLGLEIAQAQDNVAKSTFHMYRARQYTQIQKWKKALEDYNRALELNHQGWIHLERGNFLMAMGRYDLAYEDAKAAKKEVPTLTQEADKLIEASVAEIRKKYEAENPLTIIMDSAVDRHRKSRFDVMREQGILAADARRIDNFNRQKTATRKQREAAACTPTKSRG
jgi:tetratricopeptide (TPR) repeat protein